MDQLDVWGVHWIDGMLVTSSHLNQEQDFTLALSRWLSQSLAPGYGLVRSATTKTEPLQLQLTRDGDEVTLSVGCLNALMPNGLGVSISSNFTSEQAVELRFEISDELGERLEVFLYVSPDERLEFGEPLMGEELSRSPYQVPTLKLTLGRPDKLPHNCGFQIAELIRAGDEFKLNPEFVPAFLTTSCGNAVSGRMELLKQKIDLVQKSALAAIAEIKQKQPSPSEEAIFRGIFLQSESLLHQVSYNYNHVFDAAAGISARELITFFAGLVRGFSQGFLIYPELREYLRVASVAIDSGSVSGDEVLPRLHDYPSREFGFDQMTLFFDETGYILSLMEATLSFYAAGEAGRGPEVLDIGGQRFTLQHHGAVKYSFRNKRHHLTIDGVEPRATEDVVVRLQKHLLAQKFATTVIIYLGANEVDDIAAASVARKPVDDVTNPDFWLIQPNEFFPLKCSRLDRLNVILDGELDRAALESVKMEDVAIFGRTR